ncbi:glycosyltransferase family 2 protein [Microbulbifer sp. DLAB2-AF]|uniref:glycosyltransferase family 2 protein n=1 Tax=Microbulbifer sp. DLAB2-AF TaxID=3243395 RepID=UPI00403A7525
MIKTLFQIDLLQRVKIQQDLVANGDSKNKFSPSEIEDVIIPIGRELKISGWYMLEFNVTHDSSFASAELVFSQNENFEAICSSKLTILSGKLCKRIVYFPKVVRVNAIKFYGIEKDFLPNRLNLVRLAPWFAIDRILKKLSNTHLLFRGYNKKTIWSIIRKEAKKRKQKTYQAALDYYSDTFLRHCFSQDYNRWLSNRQWKFYGDSKGDQPHKNYAKPLISIIMPVHNPSLKFLSEAIDSVTEQSYSNWELCIADDNSNGPEVRAALLKYLKMDERIKIVFRDKNGHISAASNSALALAKGDYVALLDQDDRLNSNALLSVVQTLNKDKDILLAYTDEDKFDQDGKRFEPHFKPKWNPDLLLSHNYICHFVVIKNELIKKINGFREGVEGSQDHDLLLRCMPYLNSNLVSHIPEILYHWRATPGSTALCGKNKKYTQHAGLRSIRNYIQEEKLSAEVYYGAAPNTYRIQWKIPSPPPKVSLLIPTRNGFNFLKSCIESILCKTSYKNFEILILNNQSSCKDTLNFFKHIVSDPRVSVHSWDHKFNYSAINNFGVKQANGDLIGLVNNDIEPINEDWLSEMVRHACRPDIGCVGAKLYYPNDTVQHGGVILGIGGVAGHSHKYFKKHDYGYFSRLQLVQNLSAVTGACLLVKKTIFEEVGGLNEKSLPVAYNDVDLCLKVREAGYRNLWTPYAELYHHESVSRGADNTLVKRRRAQKETEYMRSYWGNQLDSDPAYNPNLTLVHEDFSLA